MTHPDSLPQGRIAAAKRGAGVAISGAHWEELAGAARSPDVHPGNLEVDRVSRNTVRRVLRSIDTEPRSLRSVQPQPKLGGLILTLVQLLESNAAKPEYDRLSSKRILQLPADRECEADYNMDCRFAVDWRQQRASGASRAYVPLDFDPGEAYALDRSQKCALFGRARPRDSAALGGLSAAYLRLCNSRMGTLRVRPRKSQVMVFDANDRAFERIGGACARGILGSTADRQSIR